MIIRQMDSFDLDDVVEIERESFSDAWSKIGYEACLKNECNHYFVGEKEGKIVGIIGFSIVVDEAELQTISVKPEMKLKIRQFLDMIYDEYVGIHLKSKKFIDDLSSWGSIMKSD